MIHQNKENMQKILDGNVTCEILGISRFICLVKEVPIWFSSISSVFIMFIPGKPLGLCSLLS